MQKYYLLFTSLTYYWALSLKTVTWMHQQKGCTSLDCLLQEQVMFVYPFARKLIYTGKHVQIKCNLKYILKLNVQLSFPMNV